MRARNAQSRGFTLLELVLVLMVIAIMAGAIAPTLRGFTIGRTNNYSATQIVSMAQYARAQAVNEGQTYRLNFDANARVFWLTMQQGGSFVAVPNEFGDRISLAKGSSFSSDIKQSPDGQYIEFTPDGRGAQAHIKLTDSMGGVVEVDCPSPTESFHVLAAGEVSQ